MEKPEKPVDIPLISLALNLNDVSRLPALPAGLEMLRLHLQPLATLGQQMWQNKILFQGRNEKKDRKL